MGRLKKLLDGWPATLHIEFERCGAMIDKKLQTGSAQQAKLEAMKQSVRQMKAAMAWIICKTPAGPPGEGAGP